MIGYLLTGAACALIGLVSGQALVLSLGRRRLAHHLNLVVERQTALYNRVNTLEANRAAEADKDDDLEARLQRLEEVVPTMISRSEVERAFAQAAQLEAQRQQAQRQQATVARLVPPFAPPAGAEPDLNTAINGQLAALEERLNRINQEFGLS